MNTTIQSPSTVPPALYPRIDKFLFAIGSPMRWGILSQLSAGQPLIIIEIAERMKSDANLVSKHMGVLRKAGLVTANRVGQYSIAPQFPVTPAERSVDFGHALLRMAPVAQ